MHLTLTSAVNTGTAIPQGCSVKLSVLASSLRNAPPGSNFRDVSSGMVWQSNSPNFTVNRHGLAIAQNSSGTAVITATSWQGQVSVTLTAGAAVIVAIEVGPFDDSANVGVGVNYTAVGLWSDGKLTSGSASPRPFPSPVSWGVTNSIGGSSGQATFLTNPPDKATFTGTAAGIVQVTATFSGVSGGTYLNIGLTGITITATNPLPPPINPPDASVPKGETQTFDAMGTFSAGPSPLDMTQYVIWRSSMASVARMSTGGPFSSVVPGVAHTFSVCIYASPCQDGITAGSGAITSSPVKYLQVTPAIVTTLTIYPGCATTVPRGVTCQFTAIGTYSDNTFANLTGSVTWSSSNGNCLSITANSGFATTMSSVANPCNANVTAVYVNPNPPGNSVGSNTIAMTVTQHALRNVTIFPANPTVPRPNHQQFSLVFHYTDGNQGMPGSTCPSWISSAPSVATIVAGTGNATAVSPGTANIGVTNCMGFQPSTVMTVVPAPLQSITVTPMNRVPLMPDDGSTTIPVAGTQDFTATGNYSDGSHSDITYEVNWSSSAPTTASISDPNNPNEATGLAASLSGPVTITATDPTTSINGSAPLVVKAISFITVSPSAQQILSPGGTAQFSATAHYASGSPQCTGTLYCQDLSNFALAWSSDHTNVATVDQNGLATAVDGGGQIATIKAQLGSIDCTALGGNCGSVSVTAAVLQSITVSCDPSDPCQMSGGTALISLGNTKQMIATGHYSDNSTQDLTGAATWASTQTTVATIDATGFLTTKGLGSTNITATCTMGGGCLGAQSTVQGTQPVQVTF